LQRAVILLRVAEVAHDSGAAQAHVTIGARQIAHAKQALGIGCDVVAVFQGFVDADVTGEVAAVLYLPALLGQRLPPQPTYQQHGQRGMLHARSKKRGVKKGHESGKQIRGAS